MENQFFVIFVAGECTTCNGHDNITGNIEFYNDEEELVQDLKICTTKIEEFNKFLSGFDFMFVTRDKLKSIKNEVKEKFSDGNR